MPIPNALTLNGFDPRPGIVHRPTRRDLPTIEGPALPPAPDYSTTGTMAKGAPRTDAFVSTAHRSRPNVDPTPGYVTPLPAVSVGEAELIALSVLADHGLIGHVADRAERDGQVITIPVVCSSDVAVRMAQVLRVHGNPGTKLPQERRFHTHVRAIPGEPVSVVITVREAA